MNQYITMVNKSKAALKHKPEETHEHLGTRVTRTEAKKLDALIEAGAFLNRADAVRTAIRQMVSGVTILRERKIPLAQARREILLYLEQHDQAYASDIANTLELDYDVVLRVLQDLRKSGEAEPA